MTKKELSPLSPAETEILRLVWQLQTPTVGQVVGALPAGRTISYATVQTMLRRLEKKGYIAHDVKGKAHIFHPLEKKDKVLKSAVNGFLDRLFGGDAVPLMQYLAENKQITASDIDRLKDILNQSKS